MCSSSSASLSRSGSSQPFATAPTWVTSRSSWPTPAGRATRTLGDEPSTASGSPVTHSSPTPTRSAGSGARTSLRDRQALHRQLAELVGADLGVARERQLGLAEEEHPARDLVARDPSPQEAAHVVLVDGGTVVGDGAQHDHLAE